MATIKRAIARVARPVWRRIGPQVYGRIDKRIDHRLGELDAGWKQHTPAFLNAVSSVKAFGRELFELRRSTTAAHAEIAELRKTVEEMRAALDAARASGVAAASEWSESPSATPATEHERVDAAAHPGGDW
ncbi:MAG TPA: hypothetical protein VF812_12145 [Ktedonobacterales bacterium]